MSVRFRAPAITAEQLYMQDERKRQYDHLEKLLEKLSESARRDREFREKREQAYGKGRGSGRPAFHL